MVTGSLDARRGDPYVPIAMNLLLLLSALLSALTGVGGRVDGASPVQAVAQGNARVAVAAKVAAKVAPRPVAALPTLREGARPAVSAVLVVASIPAWTTRRRE